MRQECDRSATRSATGVRQECDRSATGVRQECARSATGVRHECAKPELRGALGVRQG